MNRLDILSSLTKDSKCLADIGCDHAFISINAVLKYNVGRAYACDIAKMPLESAKKNINNYNLNDKIEVVLSAGYENVCFDFDTTVIAGMGGGLICDIIKPYSKKLKGKKIILQPNKDSYMLRSMMQELGFRLVDEICCLDSKKYYEILIYEEGITSFNEFELEFGPYLIKKMDEIFIDNINKKKNNAIDNLKKANNLEKISKLELEIDKYNKLLGE